MIIHQQAIYKYYIYADVNNLGRICIFETENYLEARSFMKRIPVDNSLNGYYANPKMKKKIVRFVDCI